MVIEEYPYLATAEPRISLFLQSFLSYNEDVGEAEKAERHDAVCSAQLHGWLSTESSDSASSTSAATQKARRAYP